MWFYHSVVCTVSLQRIHSKVTLISIFHNIDNDNDDNDDNDGNLLSGYRLNISDEIKSSLTSKKYIEKTVSEFDIRHQ